MKKININDPLAWRDLDWDDPVEPELLKKTDAKVNTGRINRLRAQDPAWRNKMRERFKDDAFRQKHKEAIRKVTSSKEWKEGQKERSKIQAEKIRGRVGPNKGIVWSEEIREKQRIAAKNRAPVSKKTKQKMSESGKHKSKKLTIEEVKDIKYNLRAKDAKAKYPHVSETTITRIRMNRMWKDI